MYGMYKFFIVSIVTLINFHAIHAQKNMFETFGVSEETTTIFLDHYLLECKKSYEKNRSGHTLTEQNTPRFMRSLLNYLFNDFTKKRNFSFYTPREFIHFSILRKTNANCEIQKFLFDRFLQLYEDDLNKFYQFITRMDLTKLPKHIAQHFYREQVLLYFNIYNSYYGVSQDPIIRLNEFLETLIKYAEENKNKTLLWDEMVRQFINSKAEEIKLRFMESPSFKVVDNNGMDVIEKIDKDEVYFLIPPRANKYFNIHLGDYLLFMHLYESEISKYFEKIHGKKTSEFPKEELFETAQSYVRERYAVFCEHRTISCTNFEVDSYIIYLMFSKQIKRVPEDLLKNFIEAFREKWNSFYKNITFRSLPDDKIHEFYSQRLLHDFNTFNAQKFTSESKIYNLADFVEHAVNSNRKDKPIVQDEYSEFCKYYSISNFTPKEFSNFLDFQRTTEPSITLIKLLGKTVFVIKGNDTVTSDHLTSFLKYYEEDLNSYYTNLIRINITENEMIHFYVTQLLLYFNILNSYYMDDIEQKKTMDEFIELVKSDAEQYNQTPNPKHGSSSSQPTPLTWNTAGPRIIETEIQKRNTISADTDVETEILKKKKKMRNLEDIYEEEEKNKVKRNDNNN